MFNVEVPNAVDLLRDIQMDTPMDPDLIVKELAEKRDDSSYDWSDSDYYDEGFDYFDDDVCHSDDEGGETDDEWECDTEDDDGQPGDEFASQHCR